jgi:hypothetical protein
MIIYKKEDKSIVFLNLSVDFSIEQALKQIPRGAEYKIIDEKFLPEEKYLIEYSDALDVDFDAPDEKCFKFNINKARDITRIRLRKERLPLFEKNDLLLRDALIDNDQDKLNKGITERNRLRNLTTLADTISSLDELSLIHP